MLEGMTGFSQVQAVVSGVRIGVELRSYNHRYLDIVINAPNGFSILEEKIRGLLKKNFSRGRITLNIHVNNSAGAGVAVNESLMKDYLYNIRRASKKLGIKMDLSTKDFMGLPGVFSLQNKHALINQGHWPVLEKVFLRAARQLKNMRLSEGKGTLQDLAARINILVGQINKIQKGSKAAIKKAKRRIAAEERAAYLKAIDVNEELLRFKLHLNNFKKILGNTRISAKGKELDFIAQELQRESNTIAAKCQDYSMSECVVKIKSEIEKLREQLQNIQ